MAECEGKVGKYNCKCKNHNDHHVEYEEGIFDCIDCDINVHPHYFCKQCESDEHIDSDLVGFSEEEESQ